MAEAEGQKEEEDEEEEHIIIRRLFPVSAGCPAGEGTFHPLPVLTAHCKMTLRHLRTSHRASDCFIKRSDHKDQSLHPRVLMTIGRLYSSSRPTETRIMASQSLSLPNVGQEG